MSAVRAAVRWSCRLAPPLLAFALHAGCSTTSATESPDGSASGLSPDPDATFPPLPPLRCADAACVDPERTAPLGAQACCLPSGECGLVARALSPLCWAPHGAGSVDLGCPGIRLADGTAVQGCCTSAGRCGLYDRFGDLGCVPRTLDDGGTGGAACHYSPGAECRLLVEVTCAGAEGCGAGEVCCGRTAHGSFDAFGCFESCVVTSANADELWLEVCHDGSACRNTGDACVRVPGLPGFLGRCAPHEAAVDGGTPVDAGPPVTGPSCGNTTCGPGERCCLRDPGEPYCGARGEPCACAVDANDH